MYLKNVRRCLTFLIKKPHPHQDQSMVGIRARSI